jgi:hypothetical protein
MRYRNSKKVTHQLAPDRAIPARVESTTTSLLDPAPRCSRCGRCGVVIG